MGIGWRWGKGMEAWGWRDGSMKNEWRMWG